MHRKVWIKWIDSVHRSGWKHTDEVEPSEVEDMTCESVGFLLHETDHAIGIIQSKNHCQIDAIMEIPKVAILEMRELNKRGPVKNDC
jgi:hypothetical protein